MSDLTDKQALMHQLDTLRTWDEKVEMSYPAVVQRRGSISTATDDANLGLATTRELLAELSARIEVSGGLDCRTVDRGGNARSE